MTAQTEEITNYAIGDELFRYIVGGGVFRYTVCGRREYEGDVQLEVECQNCSHGWKCKSLLSRDDYGRIIELHMLNHDEDDDQRCWHGNEGLHFWPTSNAAKQEQLKRLTTKAAEDVRKAEDALAQAKKRLNELKDLADVSTGADAMTTPPNAPAPIATVDSYTQGSYWRNYKLTWHSDVPANTKLYAETAVVELLTREAELVAELLPFRELVAAGATPGAIIWPNKWPQDAAMIAFRIWKAESERDALAAEVGALREALSRQGDNMAFVLNNCDIPEVWCAKLNDELTEDRATLARTTAARAEAGHG